MCDADLMANTPEYQWQHKRIGGEWEDMPAPHPRSPIGAYGDPPPSVTIDDGMGNLYRRIWKVQ